MTTAARPMRADARRNYERLLAVARDAITEHGAEVSLDDIARRAHVGPGTLYRHFPNRDALLAAVLADWAEELRRQGDELVADPDPAGALDRWLHLLLGHLGTYRGLAAAILASAGDDESALGHACQPMHDTGRTLVDRARTAGTVRSELTAADVHRMVHGIALITENLPDRAAAADRMLTVLVAGLRPPPDAAAGH
ncbi:TetR/AcrR family transcriptional regulator [Actinocatenispora comari]|uniref:TetR family transcriptional regulator n=1 Tax=Actinocatenispora comari TaxID=2807577 RepID=A0A8J4AD53_9ACTN|nr:TetR/AcrR family transcriptional regulator [Actinocatenispora comari]GIL28858.1 TetR family transcriptional regulator [Actinocatenispora comari]